MSKPAVAQHVAVLVEDDVSSLSVITAALCELEIERISACEDSQSALNLIEHESVDLVIFDLGRVERSGKKFLQYICTHHPWINVVVTADSSVNGVDIAVWCMQHGAADFLLKPFVEKRLKKVISSHLQNFVVKPNQYGVFKEIITGHPSMQSILRYMESIALTKKPVLITGETGTGKELIARALHSLSGRQGKFIQLNTAGMNDEEFSQLCFGVTEGGELESCGLVDKATAGSLYIAQINELDYFSQGRVLRLMQQGEDSVLNDEKVRHNDVRLIVSTSVNLEQLVERKKFRKDLYYRLIAHRIDLPSLYERKEDLAMLIEYFLCKAARNLNKKIPKPPKELLQLLSNYSFPGNVRELEAMVFDAVANHRRGVLSLHAFKRAIGYTQAAATEDLQVNNLIKAFPEQQLPTLKQVEQELIDEALRRAGNNQGIAASMLGLQRSTLNKRLAKQKKGTFAPKKASAKN